MEKKCTKCKGDKELSEFNKCKKSKDGVGNWCKECIRINSKKHYRENREYYLKKFIEYDKTKNKQKKDLINPFKEGKKCVKCGYDKCLASLDFHHINPEIKEFNIGEFGRKKGFNNIKDIEREIEKCILICSNCHREFHYLEDKDKITIEEFLKLPL